MTIEQPVPSQNPSGQVVETWQTFATVYASIEPLTGRELWDAQQVHPDLNHQVTLRYLPGLTSDMRILWDSRIFHLAEPPQNTMERDARMEVRCIESFS